MKYKPIKNIKKTLKEKYAFKLNEILRINSDATQDELATALKTSPENISRWLNAIHLPKPAFRLLIDEQYKKAIRYEAEQNEEADNGKEIDQK